MRIVLEMFRRITDYGMIVQAVRHVKGYYKKRHFRRISILNLYIQSVALKRVHVYTH